MKYAILLTGTIVPNAKVAHSNWKKRRLEYIEALKYYSVFAPVFFLENSGYNIEDDVEFMKIKNVIYRKFPESKITNRGIGYQEFEMIDKWIMGEKQLPENWIKVTGRYIITNFKEIYMNAVSIDSSLIMDVYYWNQLATTRVFCIKSEYYRRIFFGAYRHVNGAKGWWIERILYKCIEKDGFQKISYFNKMPLIEGISGTVGSKIKNKHGIALSTDVLFRKANRCISKNRLILLANVKFVLAFYIWKMKHSIEKKY